MARRKKRRSGPKKIPIVYQSGTQTIEYVGKTSSELRPEYARVRDAIHRALRVLSRLRRLRQIVLVSARFQLNEALRELPEDASDEQVADEIARLSFVMQDTFDVLAKLEHSRTPFIQEARFILTYGQTPRKREPSGTYSDSLNNEKSNVKE